MGGAVSFTIPGRPHGKERPRAGQGRIYTPGKTVSFERQVGSLAAPLFPAPFVGPVSLSVVATFAMPASWSKRKRAELRGCYHLQKPDSSNIVKAIEDGLNLIAYADDAQVAEQVCVKVWGEDNSTKVTVESLGQRPGD